MHSCLGTSNTNNIAPWDHGADTYKLVSQAVVYKKVCLLISFKLLCENVSNVVVALEGRAKLLGSITRLESIISFYSR